ncbi:MFS transporter [Butyrivibrio sp. TB]|uniref:MFS transporter n=1 Tax=Butyrivibrio sp. TB TaxID=1520809 RepID=UPI0008BCE85A|nr:MFS transporter [Butyrivibrio sp. TB]SEQ07309.1 Major Facilitator Superfamily protein [Butyrivibrio sp. TB]
MKNKLHIDNLEIMAFMDGLVFFSPVSLLIRTKAGLSLEQFFVLQAFLSIMIFVFEIPTGKITDRVGYKKTLVLSQGMWLLAMILLMLSFFSGNFAVFMIEAVVEGIAISFSSGTLSAYLYQQYESDEYVVKNARIGNCGTAGFIVSAITYAGLYHFFGLEGLLVATVISSALGLVASFGIEKEKHLKEKEVTEKKVKKLAFNLENTMIVVILACVSISFILINFFYVDKLEALGVSEEWMTAIILGYSLVQMLSEKILDLIDSKKYLLTFMLGFLAVGAMMIGFGLADNVLIIIPIMLLLPLSVTVPAYIFDEIENKVIDANGLENYRAEVLSIYNMGVNFVEIVFLFASAFVSRAGMSLSFVLTGCVMGIIGTVGFLIFGKRIVE